MPMNWSHLMSHKLCHSLLSMLEDLRQWKLILEEKSGKLRKLPQQVNYLLSFFFFFFLFSCAQPIFPSDFYFAFVFLDIISNFAQSKQEEQEQKPKSNGDSSVDDLKKQLEKQEQENMRREQETKRMLEEKERQIESLLQQKSEVSEPTGSFPSFCPFLIEFGGSSFLSFFFLSETKDLSKSSNWNTKGKPLLSRETSKLWRI